MNIDIHALNAEAGRRLAIQHVGPVKHQELPSLSTKARERAQLEAEINAFLAAGGAIANEARSA